MTWDRLFQHAIRKDAGKKSIDQEWAEHDLRVKKFNEEFMK